MSNRRRALGPLALLGLLAAGAWQLRGGSRPEPAEPARAAAATRAEHVRAARDGARYPLLAHLLKVASEAGQEDARAPAAAEDAHGHPHPISPDHVRLYRDVDLLSAAEGAIKEARYAEARALLAQHHRELPGMSRIEEEGLWLLTDCAEQRNELNVARVQAFYDRHTSASVRRSLRRRCLEAAAAQ